MKRLVDETADELARSLLEAGIEHRPPPGSKARVIVALGAGGALGMFSSNAFAWLSTTAGKVTAVGVAVGVASAVWVAVPPAREARSSAGTSGARVIAQQGADAPSADVAGLGAAGGADPGARPRSVVRASTLEREAAAGSGLPTSAADGEVSAGAGDVKAAESTASGDRQKRPSRRERRARKLGAWKVVAEQKVVASEQSELRRDGPLPAVETPPAGGALEAGSAEQASLDTEVRLVDDMHAAARRNDREALGRFLESYRATFPDGQLRREVAEFAVRLGRPDTSIAP